LRLNWGGCSEGERRSLTDGEGAPNGLGAGDPVGEGTGATGAGAAGGSVAVGGSGGLLTSGTIAELADKTFLVCLDVVELCANYSL
jgi:hypothetical protein